MKSSSSYKLGMLRLRQAIYIEAGGAKLYEQVSG